MKRSTLLAVGVTALLLVLAGQLPRLPWESLLAGGRGALEHALATWSTPAQHAAVPHRAAVAAVAPRPHTPRIAIAPPRLLASAAEVLPKRLPALPVGVPEAAVAGAIAGLVAVVSLVAMLRRDPRGRVWALARAGHSPERIARRTRVPQDAVRTMLTPGVGARR